MCLHAYSILWTGDMKGLHLNIIFHVSNFVLSSLVPQLGSSFSSKYYFGYFFYLHHM